MKKMTKILSLALALALVLGMTAMADVPSKIILKDDLSDTNGLLDTYKSNRTALTYQAGNSTNMFDAYVGGARTAGGLTAGNSNYNKFYAFNATSGKGMILAENNGKYRLRNEAAAALNNNAIIYALDQPWVYNAESYDSTSENYAPKALVAQIGITPISYSSKALGGYSDESICNSRAVSSFFYKYYADENAAASGTLTEGLHNRMYIHYQSDISSAFRVNYYPTGDFSASAARTAPTMEWNTDHTMEMVFRPASTYGFDSLTKNASTKEVFTGLNAIAMVDGNLGYGDNTTYTENSSKRPFIQAIQGVRFENPEKTQVEFYDFRLYELSLKREDFYIERDMTKTEDIAIDGTVRIYFSMPVIQGYRQLSSGAGTGPNKYYKDLLTVTDSDGVAISNEDIVVSYGVEEKDMGTYTALLGYMDLEFSGLNYDDEYSIVLPEGMYNIGLISIPDDEDGRTVTFTTQAAPSFDITLSAAEGLASGTAITADAMAGKTVYFTANATNTTGRAVNGVLAIGIYDANGNLVKYAYANKAFANAGSNSFSAAFKVAEGQTAKAFVKGTASEITFQ